MVKYELIGLQRVDYTNKQGRQISGFNCHFSYDDDNVDGLAVEKIFVKSLPSSLHLGCRCRVIYNKYGSVDEIEVLA